VGQWGADLGIYFPTLDLIFFSDIDKRKVNELQAKLGISFKIHDILLTREIHEMMHRVTSVSMLRRYLTGIDFSSNILISQIVESHNKMDEKSLALVKGGLLINEVALFRLLQDWNPVQEAFAIEGSEIFAIKRKEEGMKKIIEEVKNQLFKSNKDVEKAYHTLNELHRIDKNIGEVMISLSAILPSCAPEDFFYSVPYKLSPRYLFSFFSNSVLTLHEIKNEVDFQKLEDGFVCILELLGWSPTEIYNGLGQYAKNIKNTRTTGETLPAFTDGMHIEIGHMPILSSIIQNSPYINFYGEIVNRIYHDGKNDKYHPGYSALQARGSRGISEVKVRKDIIEKNCNQIHEWHYLMTALKNQILTGKIQCISADSMCTVLGRECFSDCPVYRDLDKYEMLSATFHDLTLPTQFVKSIPESLRTKYEYAIG